MYDLILFYDPVADRINLKIMDKDTNEIYEIHDMTDKFMNVLFAIFKQGTEIVITSGKLKYRFTVTDESAADALSSLSNN